jgi:hypothetical protein
VWCGILGLSINNLVIWLKDQLGPEGYEAACAQAIGTLRSIGWVWQGSQHASVTTRNGAIRE